MGKLVGGPISDILGGRGTLAIMLTIMGGAKLAMGRATSLRTMSLLWGLARAAHSLTWMGLMLAARPWFLGNGLSSALPLLTSSSRVGAFLGSIIGGNMLAGRGGWKGVARFTSVVTFTTAALMLTLRHGPASSKAAARDCESSSAENAPEPKTMPFGKAMRIAAREPKLWLVYGSTALVTPTFDLTTLLPMWLDGLGMGAAQIGTLGSLFPVAAVPAVLMAGKLQQTLNASQRQLLYAPLVGLSTLGMLMLSTLTTASPMIAPILVIIMAGEPPP